jgi:hypothetical protein
VLFPGYLFCQFDLQKKLSVISSTAVQYILSVNGVPAEVGDDLIGSIRRAVEAGAREPAARHGECHREARGL